MLDKMFFDNSIKEWIISLAIIIAAFIVNKIIVMINRLILKKCTEKSKIRLDIIIPSLEKPVLLGITLFAIWLALSNLNLNSDVKDIVKTSYDILTVLNITWAVAKFASILLDEYNKKSRIDAKLMPFLKRAILIIIWATGIVTALNNAGVTISALLGVLGISSLAVAMGAQDTIKNIFGGITIFTAGHLHIGDVIQFDSYEGEILDIGLRSTSIKTFEGRKVTVPNCKLIDASVINVSSEIRRRVTVKIGLTYNTPSGKMKEAIEILKSIPQDIKEIDADTVAVFSDFGDSSLVITYIYYIKKQADIRESTSKVNFEILTRFNSKGLDFAFPTQTVFIQK